MSRCEHIEKLLNYMRGKELSIESGGSDDEYEVYCGNCDEFSGEKLDVSSLETFDSEEDECV